MHAQAINTHLYDVCGFRGNSQDYYAADNSCLNKVRASQCVLHAGKFG